MPSAEPARQGAPRYEHRNIVRRVAGVSPYRTATGQPSIAESPSEEFDRVRIDVSVHPREVTEGLQGIRPYLRLGRPESALDARQDDVWTVTVQDQPDYRYARVPLTAVESGINEAWVVAANQSPARLPIKVVRHIKAWCHPLLTVAVLLLVVAHSRLSAATADPAD